MYLEFFKYTIKIRKQVNLYFKRFLMISIPLIILLSIISCLVDIFLEWNFLYNTLRSLLVLMLSPLLFSFIYGIQHKILQNKLDEKMNERVKFSFNQRVNLSIILIGILILLHVLILSPGNKIYTLFSSILFSCLGFILLFIKPMNDECTKANFNMEDERDILHRYKKN